jgi:hypothetical protein
VLLSIATLNIWIIIGYSDITAVDSDFDVSKYTINVSENKSTEKHFFDTIQFCEEIFSKLI